MQITTLEQAAIHLRDVGAIDMSNMTVEGSKLLEVCGLDTARESQSLKRQIERHAFNIGEDFCTSECKSIGGRPKTVYQFTLNAANHILLAAMTDKGKIARQDAIDTKNKSVPTLSGDPILDMMQIMVQSRVDHLALAEKVESQERKLLELESRTAILPAKPSNTENIGYIRHRINKAYGLPQRIVNEVVYSSPYAPRPAGQVRNTHESANNSTYTVWNTSEITKLFKRFVSECEMVTATQAIHPSIDGRFKLISEGVI